jgi:hypothetical protein
MKKPLKPFALTQLMNGVKKKPRLIQCVLFLLPVVFLLPFLNDFVYARGADFNDLAISHYPNAIWIQQSIQRWGEVPLWSNTILSGYPFAADPLAGLFYFPGWLELIFPLPFGLNLMMALHLIWGGVGMYKFLKAENLERWPAMAGALAFESMPKLFAHIGSGHLTLIYAVVWTPWLLLAQAKADMSPRKCRFYPAVILGLIVLADVRWILLAGLLWGAYGLRNALKQNQTDTSRGIVKRILSWGLSSAVNGLIALGLSAALLIPLAEFTTLSTRSLMTAKDVLTLSMPWGQLFGLLVPDINGFAEWMTYPGTLILILCLLGLGMRKMRHPVAFWWGVALISLVYALGENIPGMSLLARLPGFNLVRVPARGLFISAMALIVIAVMTLQNMIDQPDWGFRPARFDPLKIVVGLAFFEILLIPAVWVTTHTVPLRFIWGGVGLIAGLILVFRAKSRKVSIQAIPFVAIAILLIDLGGVNILGLDFRSPQVVTGRGRGVLNLITSQSNPDFFRLYSPSYSVPQQTAALAGMELADGVDPLQLAGYNQFMSAASGVPNEGYSVTLPPFKSGDTAADNRDYQPDAQRLGLLNVEYLTSEFPLVDPSFVPMGKVDSTYIYKNNKVLPRAWVEKLPEPGAVPIEAVKGIRKTANSIEMSADGPGLLVVSEMYYPGWKAWVDGKLSNIEQVEGILRGVNLGPGKHTIRMAFQPLSVFAGGGISLVLWLVVAGGVLIRVIQDRPKGGLIGLKS